MSSVYFDPAVGGDGSTVTDDASPTTGLANGGHRTRFVPALAQVVAVAQDVVTNAEAAVAAAATAVNAPGTSATSTTSLVIGTGSKAFTIQTGKDFVVGQFVVAANAANVTDYMFGQISAYNSGTGALTINVTAVSGSGTFASWSIGLSASGAGNGFRGIPLSGSAKTSGYTLVKDDFGKLIEIGSGGAVTVPTSIFATGDAVVLFNNTTGNVTITCSDPTTYVGGTNTVRTSVTLASRGVCNVLFITATLCVITGNVT